MRCDPFRGWVHAHAYGAWLLRGIAAVAAGIVALWVLVRSSAGEAEYVDVGVYLSVFVYSRVCGYAEKPEFRCFDIHRLAQKAFVICLKNRLALLVREDLVALLEENMEFLQ